MGAALVCSRCQQPALADASQNLCPVCMIQLALGGGRLDLADRPTIAPRAAVTDADCPSEPGMATAPPTTIFVNCPCGKRLKVRPELRGKRVKCSACGRRIDVRPASAASSPQAAAMLPPQLPVASTQDAATLPPQTPARPGEETVAPPLDGYETVAASSPSGAKIAEIHGYEILGELGRGGMGVVYKAKHIALRRTVALKMILGGGHAGGAELDRFRIEAESIARLQHPNIVQIHEVGEHDGLPFFSLEFCPGGGLDRKLAGTPLPPRQAAALVEKLAHAMQAAHDKGVIHRDLKPANVLLAEDGAPKITDFGLAKQLDEAGKTQDGSVMGTPSYMAPEQAGGKSKELGPACDIYALGAILYELLTGRPPFKAATPLDTLMQVVTDEPVPPSQLQHKMPLDVETICLRCLQKEPGKRYASAQALADDLRRYQNGEPIRARPVGSVELVVKWVRRRPMVAGLSAAVVVFGFVAFSGVTGGMGWALVERAHAIDQEKKTANALIDTEKARVEAVTATKEMKKQLFRVENLLYINHFTQAFNHFQTHDLVRCQLALDDCLLELRGPEYGYLVNQLTRKARTLRGHISVISCLALSGDGKRLISGGLDTTIKIWDVEAGQETFTLRGHAGKVTCLALSSDGKRLFSGSMDNTIKVWDPEASKEILTLRGHTGVVGALALSGDGKRLFSASFDNSIKVWDLEAGAEAVTLRGHTSAVDALALSGDGKRLYSGSMDGAIKAWDVDQGKETLTLHGHVGGVSSLVLSGDGKRLFSGFFDSSIQVWNLDDGKEALSLRGHAGGVSSLLLSSDGKRLFSASFDNSIKGWDLNENKEIFTLCGHTGAASALALSGDDKRLFSASWDSTIKVWDLEDGKVTTDLKGKQKAVTSLALSGDGKRLFSGSFHDSTIEVWDLGGDNGASKWPGFAAPTRAAISRDGKWLLSGDFDSNIKIWNLETGKLTAALRAPTRVISCAAVRTDSQILFGADWNSADRNTIQAWDLATGNVIHTLRGHTNGNLSLALSEDGQRLYSGSWDTTVKVWDLKQGKEIHTLRGHERQIASLAVSSDGKRLFSGCFDSTIKVWDLDTGKEVLTLRAHTGKVTSLTLSGDGKRLFSGSEDKTIKVWNVDVGKELITLRGHNAGVSSLALSGDGKRLYSGSQDSIIKVWQLGGPPQN